MTFSANLILALRAFNLTIEPGTIKVKDSAIMKKTIKKHKSEAIDKVVYK